MESADFNGLNQEAVRLAREGRYGDAVALAEQAARMAERALGPEHPDVASILGDLAEIYLELERGSEAERLFERVVSIRSKILSPDHPDVATVLGRLARALVHQGRYREADALLRRSISLLGATLGPDHPDLTKSLHGLAKLHHAEGRFAEAEPLYKRCLARSEGVADHDNGHVVMALNGLATLYVDQERPAKALRLFKRALRLCEKALGPDHPLVGTILSNLAETYRAVGRNRYAEPLFRRAVAIREAALGPDHPTVATTLSNFALSLEDGGRFGEAELLLKRSLEIRVKAFGSDHRDVAATKNNLSGLYFAQGRYAEAEPLLMHCISLWERTLGPEHPHLATALNNLAKLYENQGRHDDAATLRARASEIPPWEVVDIPVYFATNRNLLSPPGRKIFGENQQIDIAKVEIGMAIVRSSKVEVQNRAQRSADAFGQLHKAIGRQTKEMRLNLRRVDLADDGGQLLAADVRNRLAQAVRFPNQVLIYAHGYNTSFDEAVRRTAMIAFDLNFDGAVAVFSWPSRSGLLGYGGDRERARIAAPFLLYMIDNFTTSLPEARLHLLAHSTGGELVLNVLERLADRSHVNARANLGELILAHADVDRDRFQQAIPNIRKLGLGVTAYSSAEDWAMWASRVLRRAGARIGGQPTLVAGVDSIDITGLGSGRLSLNHNVFVHNPLVFGDIARLLATGQRPPHDRTPSFAPVTTPGGTYWEYKTAG